MNLVKEAIDLGFSNAAVMDTKKLVFVPEYRNFCEENRCGCYNLNPACPPSCGTAEEMKQRAFRYKVDHRQAGAVRRPHVARFGSW